MKISATHLQEFRTALSYAEQETNRINALVCMHAASDRIEMNRMISKNTQRYQAYVSLLDKLNAKFESQLEKDNMVEPFTPEEIDLANSLIQQYIAKKESELNDMISLSENNVVLFSVRAAISGSKTVFEDLIKIFKSYGVD
jgi:uncharacterized protein VirK/YbjX